MKAQTYHAKEAVDPAKVKPPASPTAVRCAHTKKGVTYESTLQVTRTPKDLRVPATSCALKYVGVMGVQECEVLGVLELEVIADVGVRELPAILRKLATLLDGKVSP